LAKAKIFFVSSILQLKPEAIYNTFHDTALAVYENQLRCVIYWAKQLIVGSTPNG
jgi:hypothetical protein